MQNLWILFVFQLFAAEICWGEEWQYDPRLVLPERSSILQYSISEDGLLLYLSQQDGMRDLWLRDISSDGYQGSQRLTYTLASEEMPTISPSGRWIAYVGLTEDPHGDIYLIDRDQSEEHFVRVTDGHCGESSPTFSADEQMLYFTHQCPGETERTIVRKALDASTLSTMLLAEESVVDLGGDAAMPSLSPAGDMVVFTSRREGKDHLFLASIDSNRASPAVVSQLTSGPGVDLFPAWGKGPDSNERIYFSRILNDTNGDGQLGLTDKSRVYSIGLSPTSDKEVYPHTVESISASTPHWYSVEAGEGEIAFLSSDQGGTVWGIRPQGVGKISSLPKMLNQYEQILLNEQRVVAERDLERKLPILFEVAVAHRTLGNGNRARSRFREIKELSMELPVSSETQKWLLGAEIYLNPEKMDDLLSQYSGQVADSWFIKQIVATEKGRYLLEQGDFSGLEEVLSLFDELLGHNDLAREHRYGIYLMRSKIYRALGQERAAKHELLAVIDSREVDMPNLTIALEELLAPLDVMALREMADRQRAERPLLSMATLNRLGDLYFKEGEWRLARDAYRQVLDSFQFQERGESRVLQSAARLALSEIYYREQHFQQALALYQEVIREDRDRSGLDERIIELATRGYIDKSIAAGKQLIRNSELSAARVVFKRVVDFSPENTEAWRGYIQATVMMGEREELVHSLRESVRSEGSPASRYALALALSYLDEHQAIEEAASMLQQLIEENERNPFYYLTYGYLLEISETIHGQSGAIELALVAYKKAYNLFRFDADKELLSGIYLNLGNVYTLLNQFANSYNYYQKREELGVRDSNQMTEILYLKRYAHAAFLSHRNQEAVRIGNKLLSRIEQIEEDRPQLRTELMDRMALYYQEMEDHSQAAEFFLDVYHMNYQLGRVDNLSRNMRGVAYNLYKSAVQSHGEKRHQLLEQAYQRFEEVIELAHQYGVSRHHATPETSLIKIDLSLSLDQATASHASHGFSRQQEVDLAHSWLAQIEVELGRYDAAYQRYRKILLQFEPGDAIEQAYSLSLIHHRMGHISSKNGDFVQAFNHFMASGKNALLGKESVQVAVNLANMSKQLLLVDGDSRRKLLRQLMSQLEEWNRNRVQSDSVPKKKLSGMRNILATHLLRLAEQLAHSDSVIDQVVAPELKTMALHQWRIAAIPLREATLRDERILYTVILFNLADSIEELESVLESSRSVRDSAVEWRVLVRLGRYEEALEVLRDNPASLSSTESVDMSYQFEPWLAQMRSDGEIEQLLNYQEEIFEIERVQQMAPLLWRSLSDSERAGLEDFLRIDEWIKKTQHSIDKEELEGNQNRYLDNRMSALIREQKELYKNEGAILFRLSHLAQDESEAVDLMRMLSLIAQMDVVNARAVDHPSELGRQNSKDRFQYLRGVWKQTVLEIINQRENFGNEGILGLLIPDPAEVLDVMESLDEDEVVSFLDWPSIYLKAQGGITTQSEENFSVYSSSNHWVVGDDVNSMTQWLRFRENRVNHAGSVEQYNTLVVDSSDVPTLSLPNQPDEISHLRFDRLFNLFERERGLVYRVVLESMSEDQISITPMVAHLTTFLGGVQITTGDKLLGDSMDPELLDSVQARFLIEKNSRMAMEDYQSGRLERSYRFSKRALMIAKSVDGFEDEIPLLLAQSRNIAVEGRLYPSAESDAMELVHYWENTGDQGTELIEAQIALGVILSRQQKYLQSVDVLRDALELQQQIPVNTLDRSIRKEIALVLENSSDYHSSLSEFERMTEEESNHKLKAEQYEHIGRVYDLRLNQWASAKESYQQMYKRYMQLGDQEGVARSLLNIGRVERLLGNFGEAVALFTEAEELLISNKLRAEIKMERINLKWFQGIYGEALIELNNLSDEAEQQGWKDLRVMVQNTKGLLWWSFGDHKRAVRELNQAIRMAKQLNAREDEVATAYNNLGLVMRDMGELDQALSYFEQALLIDREVGNRWGTAYSLRNRAQTLMKQERYGAAEQELREALSITTEIGNRVHHAKVLLALGEVLRVTNQQDEAEEVWNSSLKVASELNLREVQWRALLGLSKIKRLSHPDQTVHLLRQAVEIVEEVKASIHADRLKEGYVADKQVVYEELIQLLVDEGDVRGAFEIAERSRGRNFLDLLSGVAVSEFSLGQQALLKPINQQRKVVQEQAFLTAQSQSEFDMQLLSEEQDRLRDMIIKLQVSAPMDSELTAVKKMSSLELQRLLDPETVLTVYYQLPEELLVWVVSHEKMHLVRVDRGRKWLSGKIAQFREKIERLEPLEKEALELWKVIMQPVEKLLQPFGQIGIVPHHDLHYLSYATLFDGESFLVEKQPLFYLPTADYYHYGIKRRKDRSSVLAIANPDLGDPVLDLPFSQNEVRSIQWRFPQIKTLVKEKATEGSFVHDVGNYDILHVASHGEFFPHRPLDSSLKFTPDSNHDGLLTVREIFGLQTQADMIVLSACQSGMGKITPGDDVVGMNRSFFHAGAHTLLSSQWQVSDLSTALLIKSFYRKLQSNFKSESLRYAMLQVKSRYSHPAYWGAFLLSGDYQ